MDCAHCGFENREGTRFCVECGTALALRCPGCRAEVRHGQKFCGECGTALTGSPAPLPTPSAVRKTVTVLFADLGGSTGFGERTDAEISRQVLAQYHALLQAVIDDHRGIVAKFMGDGMMATFGIPQIAEDDAHRAVRAGIDMQRRFGSFAAEVETQHGEVLTLRVGVNTGEVVIAAGDADLVGDALNVAARLEKACRPGQVLVGEETWRITRGDLAYEPLGEVTVAGRAGPVATYEAVASGAVTSESVAPFVGRAGESARLRAAFDRARLDDTAVLVTVLGSPGMGKTRLSREVASTLAADARATTFEIRCDRSGGATFAPFADLVRAAAGISEVEDVDDTRVRIAALVNDDADRSRVVEVIAGVLGAAPARSVEETFWGVRRVVESLAADRPVVMVIDDIQWAEPKLLDLLEHLAEWVQTAAVLLVCLARPELRELRPALTETGRRVADVVALDGLDASATAELASGLLGSALPSELVDRLPASTDGNPLFVRELVRMLVDDAVIRRRDDGTWELAIDAEAIEVPPTIQSLLATRVERLPAEELRVLELASVVGAEFSVGALVELAGDDIAVPPVLERLRHKELVEPTGSYWGDDPLHRFHHVLIRDAAYRRLLKTTRAELHRHVGAWTDAISGDLVGERETAIAFHYEQAHRYRTELGMTDDETDRLGRRAAELMSVAARRALDREDLTSAGALARRALATLPASDVEDRAELLLIACECFLASGDVARGAPLVDALGALADGNEQLAAWAACYRAQLVGLTDPEGVVAAEGMATGAAATLERLGDGAGEAKAHQVRAGLLARLGRVGEAEVVLDLALGAARASDDRRRVTAVLGAAPQAALFGPSPVARAGGRCLDVVRLLRITTASPSVEATSMRCQAVLEALRGRFDVSRSMLATARASLEDLGLRHGLLETDLFTGMVELIAGDASAAIEPLRAAYEGLGTLGVGADAGQAAALLATALLARGETDEAELMASESEALAGQNLKTAIAWRVARAEVHAARGDAPKGVTLAEEAVEIAAATDLVLDHADACVILAELRDAVGDAPGARSARADAARLYEAKGATVPAARLGTVRHEAVEPSSAPARARASDKASGETRTPVAENAATRLTERVRDAANRRDRTAIGRLLGRDYVQDDRRSIVAVAGVDPHEMWEDLDGAIEQGFVMTDAVVIAVRGERLSVERSLRRTPGGDESPRITLNELDADGRLARLVLFDDGDLATALTELDAWYLGGEGADANALRMLGRLTRTCNDRDWDSYRDCYSPMLRAVDRRTIGWPELDRDGVVEMLRGYAELATDMRLVVRKVWVHDDVVLTTVVGATGSDDGFEWVQHTLGRVDADGRLVDVEIFDDGDFERALARFDEFAAGTAADRRTARLENMSTRVIAQWAELTAAGRFDEAARRFHPDVVRRDFSNLVSFPTLETSASFSALVEDYAAVGYRSLRVEPIAVRGDRLHLARTTVRTPEGFETVSLYVNECDDAGLCTYSAQFDEADLTAAIGELDERFFTGEGAPFQRVLRASARFVVASVRSDFEALRELLAPDFVYIDRQPLGAGEGDRDYFIDFLRTRMAEGSTFNRVARVNEHALLVVQQARMLSEQGSTYERVAGMVAGVDADDRINRIEFFAEEDFDAALARFDDLGAAAADARRADVENTATRVHARVRTAISAGRPEDLRALITRDFVQEDRRTLVALPTLARPGLAEHLALMREQGFVSIGTNRPIAVRGERLCLERGTARTRAGDESTLLRVVELDEEGRETRNVVFDADDVQAAQAELDAAYVAGEGAAHLPVLMAAGAWAARSERGDFDRMRELMAPDFVCIDRGSLALFGDGDREYFIEASRARVETATDGVHLNRVVQVIGNAILTVREEQSITEQGNVYERVSCWVIAVDDAGLIVRFENFDEDRYPSALARLHELGAPSLDPPTAVLENLATSVHARILAAINDGDAEAQRALVTRDFAQDDRRAMVAVPDQDRRGIARYHEIMIEQGYEILPPEPVAVRGERLTLSRVTHRTVTGDESILLALIELDTDGLIARATSFDEEDLAVALAELYARYLAGEGAPHAELLLACRRFEAASSSDDLDALRELMSADFVIVDHTLLGFGTGDREYYVAMRASWAEVPVAGRSVVRRIEVVDGALLAVREDQVEAEDGGTYERCRCYVLAVDASRRITRFELYEEHDLPAARARLDELGASDTGRPTDAPSRPENQVTRIIGQALEHLNRKDWDSAGAMSFLADDIERFDRRRTVSAPTVGDVEGFLANAMAIYDVFEIVTPEVVAVRGERLALIRLHCGHAPDFGLQLLCVYEFDERELLARESDFDDDDLDAALRELEDRYATHLDRDRGHLALRLGDLVVIANQADADGYRELFTEDCEFANHRRLSWPVDTMDDAIVWARSLSGVARHVIVFPDVELGLDTALVWQEEQFATRQESEYAGLTILVLHLRAGRFDVFESYDPEDEPAARARFEELVETSRFTPYVDNWLVRLTERNGWLARHTDDRPWMLAADCELDDRRVGVNAGAVTGDVDVAASIQSGIDVFGGLDLEPLAVRGELLALYRWAFVTDGGFEAPGLCVVEMGDDDLTRRITSFDASDLAAAVDYLEERCAARAGEDLTRGVELLMAEGQRAVNHADFDALAGLVPPDISFESHLTLGVATTRDTYLEALRLLVEQTAAVAVVFAKMYLTPCSSLAAVSFVGTTPEGNRYEWSYAQVGAADASGQVTHIAVFDAERWDDAVARFDELTAAAATAAAAASVVTVRPATVDNAAARALVRAGELLMTDVEAALELFAEDAQSENRQAGPLHGVTAVGRDGWRTALTSWADTYQAVRLEPVAVRGEHLALVRYEFEADGFVTRALGVVETDGQGRVRRLVNFDEDDFDAAVNELDERCAATLDVARVPETNAPSAAGPEWLLDPMAQAFARRDWDWIRGHTAPDVELHDHRSTVSSHHAVGIDAVIDLLRGFADVGFETLENIRVAGRGDRLGLIRRVYRTATGFELNMLAVVEFGATGLAKSFVLFDADALVPALDELDIRYARSGALTRPERQVLLGFAGVNHRVWAELEAVLAPDVELADHRRLGWPGSSGKEHLVRELQSLVAQVADVVAIVQDVEVSGPAVLTLNHQVGTSTDGAAVDWAWHLVFAIGADGLITHMEYFDLDDGARARARYDELAHPDVVERLVHRFVRVYNTRDWDGLRTTYPDLVMVDHRPASFGEMVGAQALVEYLDGLLALVPDLHVEVPEIAAVAAHGVVFRMVGSGHSTDGGDVEIDIVLCSTIVGGQVRAETFPADALEAALECWLDAGS